MTRLEMYISYLLGEVNKVPTPVSRLDKYLYYLCTKSGDLPKPVSRLDKYLSYLCGGSVVLPTPVSRLDKYFYNLCTGMGETPNPISSGDKLLKELCNKGLPTEELIDLLVSYENTTLSITSDTSGDYELYYGTSNNNLSEYDKIADLQLEANKAVEYTYFNTLNIAPSEATHLLVKKSGRLAGKVELPSGLKIKDYGDKLYSVGLLSDIHIDGNGDGNNLDSGDSQNDLKRSLSFFNDKVDFVVINGDITYYGYEEDYLAYKNIVKDYNKPIYTIRGNHECYIDGKTYDANNTKYADYLGDLYYEIVQDKDVFLFLGNMAESGTNGFSSESLAWLANKLNVYQNKRVFLFVHYPVKQVGYAGTVSTKGGITNEDFINLITQYKENLFYFSGHTHISLNLQNLDADSNIKKYDTICNRIHIPSGTKPRDINNEDVHSDSEGYIMDVYKKAIVLYGIDFISGKYLPIATYAMDTIESGDLLDVKLELYTGVDTKTGTKNEVAYTFEDRAITLSGTATADGGVYGGSFLANFNANTTYNLTIETESGDVPDIVYIAVIKSEDDSRVLTNSTISDCEFTPTEDIAEKCRIYIRIKSGVVYDYKFKISIKEK